MVREAGERATEHSLHPRPAWIDAWASMPREQAHHRFAEFSLDAKLTAAMFMALDGQPPNWAWGMQAIAPDPATALETLVRLIAREPDDACAYVYIGLVKLAVGRGARFASLSAHVEARVAKMSNESLRRNSSDDLKVLRRAQ